MCLKTEASQFEQNVLPGILQAFKRSYNVVTEDMLPGVCARCEYFETTGQHFLSRRAELWSADGEEFLYIVHVPKLDKDLFETLAADILADGMARLHIGPGHMYSFITPVIFADRADEAAVSALKRRRHTKSFRFSLHGWMDLHLVLALEDGSVFSNAGGRRTAKAIKQILTKQKGKEVAV